MVVGRHCDHPWVLGVVVYRFLKSYMYGYICLVLYKGILVNSFSCIVSLLYKIQSM